MTSLLALPEPLRGAVTAEFVGEPVLWAGRPDATRIFWPAMAIWLAAIPWTIASLIWESIAVGALIARPGENLGGAPWGLTLFFALFGLPFVLIGFGMLASPFWLAWRAQRTAYALSAKRLAIIVIGPKAETTSIARRDIVETKRRERAAGSGDIDVVVGWRKDSDGAREVVSHQLVGVPDVRKVDALIRNERA